MRNLDIAGFLKVMSEKKAAKCGSKNVWKIS